MIPRAPRRQTPRFAASIFRRTVSEGLCRRAFGKSAMAEVVEFLGGKAQCVYCGDANFRRWDHLISIREGGETVIGNMVPSCSPCDDSKGQLDFETWMRSDKARSPKSREVDGVERRIALIHRYQEHYHYVPGSGVARLKPSEKAQLDELLSRLDSLCGDTELFLKSLTGDRDAR